ncbi:hypothetical protein DLJ53_01475 [Acuticoccus sediminis]|uniref:Calcineurin-like phosphoesterase domain-containing protein n=1 Tax=Acuticoccus sediminis TaxID=2184697 RepID=A0A8B2NX29_9HYPH|nr:metallophosphoesterase [Acuticoccus sediminis]RAI03220.1 hypothetical protein DLJ53_01475 [Acuticoccus sediminis]
MSIGSILPTDIGTAGAAASQTSAQPIDDTTDGPDLFEDLFTRIGDFRDGPRLLDAIPPLGIFGEGGLVDDIANGLDAALDTLPVVSRIFGDGGPLGDLSLGDIAETVSNAITDRPLLGPLLDGGDAGVLGGAADGFAERFGAPSGAGDHSLANPDEKYSVIVFPDTQYYSNGALLSASPGGSPTMFTAMTRWVVDNAAAENIVFVTHLGDVVDNGTSEVQYARADAAMSLLDGEVAYSILPGNHDFVDVNQYDVLDEKPGNRGAQLYLETFGPDRFLAADADWYGGASPNGLSSYQYVTMGDVTMLHIALEWNNLKYSLPWAKEVIERNPGMPTFISTHANVGDEGGDIGVLDPTPDIGGRDLENGSFLWDYLVEDSDQVFMVLNGHFSRYGALDEAGEYTQVSTNAAGHSVYEMLYDPQAQAYGGAAYFRQLEFEFRDGNDLIGVRTRSALGLAEETDANSRFTIEDIDFADPARFGSTERVETSTLTLTRSLSATLASDGSLLEDGSVFRDVTAGEEHQTLLRFKGLDDLPAGAEIVSAVLVLSNLDEGDGAQLYRMDARWTQFATWDSLGDGVTVGEEAVARQPDVRFFDGRAALADGALQQLDGDPFVGDYPYGFLSEWDATIQPQADADGNAYADVTESVRAWVEDGEDNLGWALIAPQSSGYGGLEREPIAREDAWSFATSGAARPELIIEYVEDTALVA